MLKNHPFLRKLNEKHLSTWCLLPLLDMNIDSFGRSNHINTFIVKGARQIAVQIVDLNLCRHMVDDEHFVGFYQFEDRSLLVYDMIGWEKDFDLFCRGKYSKLSEDAMIKIKTGSGLNYKVPDGHGTRTDAVLLALDRHKSLAQMWMDLYGLKEHELPEELLSIPQPDSYITI